MHIIFSTKNRKSFIQIAAGSLHKNVVGLLMGLQPLLHYSAAIS